jgi:Ca2+-binding RTX toxin-like protein
LASSGGTSVTLIGGTGDDTLTASGGSAISVQGGSGNDTLSVTAGTSVTLFGGTGSDSLASSGGITVTLAGGIGNDTLATSGGTQVLIQGGTGNDTLSATGGTSITMFGGTGSDSLASSGGTTVSMTGGSGNDTLTTTGDNSATVQAGGGGNDSLASGGGTSVTLFGGSGNDSLSANGGSAIGLAGLQGNNTYAVTGSAANPITVTLNDLATFGQSLPQEDGLTPGINTIHFPGVTGGITLDLSNASAGAAPTAAQQQQVVPGAITVTLVGQFQNVVGTPGSDFIKGDSSANVLSGGTGGNDTLVGGSGPATLVAGSGNDSLAAGTGGTTFQFPDLPTFGSDTIDPPSGSGINLLDFSQFGGPVAIDLGSTSKQTVNNSSGLALTLQNPSEINALADSIYNDSITGNSAGDQFFVGGGNDTFTGGGGADSFFFGGSPFGGSALGTDVINETSAVNTLNFYGFDGPVSLNLKQTGTQTVSQGTASNLKLTLSNPSAFNTVIGSTFGGTIVGNDNANETIVGGAGLDSLVAGGGNDSLQANVQQVVYLDFPSAAATLPGDHLYTAAEEAAVLAGVQQIYADFNYFFTLSQATAQQQASVTGGQYAAIVFDGPVEGGAAYELDLNNHDLGGLATVNVSAFLGDPSAGLVAPTESGIIGLTTEIAAHELGHLSGLQHQDAFGPIGSGIYAGVNSADFSPAFPGPQLATETAQDVMASPDSVGTTLQDAADPTNLGERDAIALAFNDTGTVLQQANLTTRQAVPQGTNPVPNGAVVLQSYDEAGTIYQVGTPPPLAVPNPLLSGTQDYGKTFNVTAAAVNSTTAPGQVQYFAVSGTAGEVMTFQVISATDTLNLSPILPALEVLDSTGNVLPYYGDTTNGAFNIHEFESGDSTLLDVNLPTTGTYYIGVLDRASAPVGYYQLFMYSFAAGTGTSSGLGDTLVGGGGNDTLVGSSGNDLFLFPNGLAGHATVNAVSGHDVADARQSPNEQITTIGDVTVLQATKTTTSVTSSSATSIYGQNVTFTAAVTAQNSATPTGSVQFFIDGIAFGSAVNVQSNGQAVSGAANTTSTPALTAISHSITAVYTNTDGNFDGSDNKASPLTQNVNKASPTFSRLTPSQTITAGTASINLSGVLSAGSLVPTGETITITAGSASTTATINADGSFSATLTTNGLAASTGSYTITYNYGGDTNFNSTNDNSTSLTVNPGGPADVTSKVSVTLGGMQVVFGSNKNSKYNYVQAVTIKNTCNSTINGPIYYELIGLANATLYNANGTSKTIHPGVPYLLMSSGILAAGASVTVNLQFYDPPPNVIPSYSAYAVASGGTP